MGIAGALTAGLLIERLGVDAGPAVWGYREAVVAAAAELDIGVDHDVGLVQIGLQVAGVAELVGWRIDHGWYLVRRRRRGEPPAVGPTRYRPASDPLDWLLPAPAAVAAWLRGVSNGHVLGTGSAPGLVVSAEQLDLVLRGLRAYLRAVPGPGLGYSWTDDRPLTQVIATACAVEPGV